jgi:predicted N-acyltransferase
MSRGFEPSETFSAHAFADRRLHHAFAQALAHETVMRQQELAVHRAGKR